MKLTPIFIDFETFWSQSHSLSCMSPIAYVKHRDTEIISCAMKVGQSEPVVFVGEDEIRRAFNGIEWEGAYAIGHNMTGFDSMILRWRFNVRPAMWGCTLAMSRPQHNATVGGSLSKLAQYYGLGTKNSGALLATKGKHLKDFTEQELQNMRVYNRDDTEMCAGLFWLLLPDVPKSELRLIDMTTRMLVEPQFEVDKELLLTTLGEEKARKKKALLALAEQLGIDSYEDTYRAELIRARLASAAQFAGLLESRGVEVPMKPSPTDPNRQTYALARTDEAYTALREHPDPIIAAAANARLDIKSTILETRIEAFLDVADAMDGKMPIAKNYYAAHTGRFGGSMGLNQENLPRIDPDNPKPSDALRKSLRAPKGHKVVVADLSGIELRVNHFLWQVPSSMALFKAYPEKADLYRVFAAALYGVKEEQVTKWQRQVGKVAHLGLGFGAGPTTFQKVAKTMAGITLQPNEAENVVTKWRREYQEIVAGWRRCQSSLMAILHGANHFIDPWEMCTACREGIQTPVGVIRYPSLHMEPSSMRDEWWYGEGRNRTRIYAGKITENIVQHLARNILTDNALAIRKLTGLYPVHTVHDELVYIVPEAMADQHLAIVHNVMRTPPTWWPELVTWSSGDIGDTYGDAK